jgi:hypothetical protein
MNISSEKIIENARTWIGTKFALYSSIKKNEKCDGACDCFGFISGVLIETGFSEVKLLFENYQKNKINHYKVVEISKCFFIKKDFKEKEELKEGQIVCFEIEKNFLHLGFIASVEVNSEKIFTLIHASSKTGSIVEHFLDDFWIKKIKFLFLIK